MEGKSVFENCLIKLYENTDDKTVFLIDDSYDDNLDLPQYFNITMEEDSYLNLKAIFEKTINQISFYVEIDNGYNSETIMVDLYQNDEVYIKNKIMDIINTKTVKHDITQMCTISTVHITQSTAKRLQNEPDLNYMNLSIYEYEFGWFIWIQDVDRILNSDISIPDDLKACIEFAAEQNCQWLRLDCDGPEIPQLEIFLGNYTRKNK